VYYDYQAFVDHEQRDSHLRFGVFGSDDRLRLTNRASAAGGQFDQANAFWNVQMLHEARLAPALQERSVVSFGYFLQRFSVSTLHVETRAYPIIARSEFSAQLSDQLELRFGPDLLYAPFHSKFAVPQETGPNTPDSGSFLLRPPRIFSDGTAYVRPAFYAELKAEPVMYQRLLVERNRTWLPEIEKLLARPRPAFVVVGAAHLVGADGLIALLSAKGYRVEQR